MHKIHKPNSCQHEGTFPGIKTVLTAFKDTTIVVHNISDRCKIEYPHKIEACKEFDNG